MATFRVRISGLETGISPVALLRRLMRELRGAGGIVPSAPASAAVSVPMSVTFIFMSEECEDSADFARQLGGLMEREVGRPVSLSIEKKDDATGSWIVG